MKIKRSGLFYVYIVKCSDKTYYTGYTPNIERRIKLHNTGKGAKYTRDRRPVKLVWSKKCSSLNMALKKEFAIKRLTRKNKEKLIKNRGTVSRRTK